MVTRRLPAIVAFAWLMGIALPSASDAGQTGTPAPASREAAQVAVSSSEQPSTADAASLERIKNRLAQEPSLVLPSEPPMFSVYIEAKLPSLDSFLGPGWTHGPALPMAMSHREFLDMVTPKVAQPYGSFGPKELAVLLPQAMATGLLVNYLPSAIKGFINDRRAAAARREVLEVLAELERRRLEAEARGETTDPPR